MQLLRFSLVIFLLIVTCTWGASQSFNSGKNRKTYKGLKTTFPHQGIGFKLGDPVAISYRFYLTEKFSFGADFGTVSSSLYNRYYRNQFDSYVDSDTFRTSSASIDYLSHKVRSDLVGEAKFVYQFAVLSPGLQLFVGGGWQWKSTNITYTYLYNNSVIENSPGSFQRRRLTMGPQIVGGMEYSYSKIPVKAFLEMEYYTDVQVDPGWHRFEGGVGLRYIF
jgi:hypothetical protein